MVVVPGPAHSDSSPLMAPAGVTHQETVDQLWYLSELVALGAVLPPESSHELDGRRKETRFEGIILSVHRWTSGRSHGSPVMHQHTARCPPIGGAPGRAHIAAA